MPSLSLSYNLYHIPGIKNTAADAGSRNPVGDAESEREGIDEMLMGAGGRILETAITSEEVGRQHEDCPEDYIRGPKVINGLQLGGLYLRAGAGERWDRHAPTSSTEISKIEQDLIISDLEAATGVWDDLHSPEAITPAMVNAAAKEDREYSILHNLL